MDFYNQTVVHPLGLAALSLCSVIAFFISRQWIVLPVLLLACFVSAAQRIVVIDLDFSFMRILTIVILVRAIVRSEWNIRLTPIDYALFVWVFVRLVMYTILWRDTSALILGLGRTLDFAGLYLVFRISIQSLRSFRVVGLSICMIAVPTAALFIVEGQTGRNLFSFLGGVPEMTIIRDGRLRCQGPFPHSILAGVFWSALLPFVMMMWRQPGTGKALTILAASTTGIIVFLTASSTPIGTLLATLAFFALVFARQYLSYLRWGVVGMLVLLQLTMNQPVYHLIARIRIVSGSTGYHRYLLIHNFFTRIDEWFVTGVRSTAHWGFGQQDVTNQFIAEAVVGGILTFTAFIVLLVLAFRGVGKFLRYAPRGSQAELYGWAVGTSLAAQCVGFIGVTYFGQIFTALFLPLAMASTLWALGSQAKMVDDQRRKSALRQRAVASSPASEDPVDEIVR